MRSEEGSFVHPLIIQVACRLTRSTGHGLCPGASRLGALRHQECRSTARTRSLGSQSGQSGAIGLQLGSSASHWFKLCQRRSRGKFPGYDPFYTRSPLADTASSLRTQYDEEDQAALADLVSKKGQQAADDAINNVGEAKSIKCTDCGKIFSRPPSPLSTPKSRATHRSKRAPKRSSRSLRRKRRPNSKSCAPSFSAKRAAQSKLDAEESKANEKIRRKAGQDLSEVKEDMKRKEQIKEAERKRKEKAEDAAFKAKVKAQIEADKRERAAKAAAEKAAREGGGAPVAAVPAGPSAAALATSAGPQASKSSANEARLRVRAPGGMWMGTLPADATLGDVAAKIKAEGKDGGAHLKVSDEAATLYQIQTHLKLTLNLIALHLQFSTTFPRKFFDASDASKTLRELGLVPSAALEASAQ